MSIRPIVQSRRQLFDFLEEQMNTSYRSILKSGRLENETTQVKTYLVEFDWQRHQETKNNDYLTTSLTVLRNKQLAIPSVVNTDEEGFYEVEWQIGKQPIRVYLDTATDANRRFWIGYSLSPAAELDKILDYLSSSPSSRLDRVWLWPELLRQVQGWGEFRGVGLDYDHRYFEADRHKKEVDSTSYLKCQLWGGPETQDVLAAIMQVREGKVNLSKIRMKYSEEERKDKFVIEDIKFNGKLTCRGTSFASHQILLNKLRVAYAEKVEEMEINHTICCSIDKESRTEVSGEPVIFEMIEPIVNLDLFCNILFSGQSPFHLWGLVQQSSDDSRVVDAVDLHTGSRLFFEIYQDELRMYMYTGSCGNTVVRLFTNLQRTLNASITAKNIAGQNIF